jgi:hypothetical protein
MKLKSMIRVIFAAAAMITSTSAFAQWTVYDPVNWVQNLQSARSAISNEINTARALIQQVNAAKDLARSTAGLKNISNLAGLDQAQQLYRSLIDVDGRLGTNLDSNTKLVDDLRAQYGASNMSWDQFATSRSQIESRQRQINKDRYNAVAQSMEETSRRRQAIVSQLSTVQGQTEAMQTLGAALDVIIGQNQQIIAAMMANTRMQESQGQINDAQEQMAKNQRELYQQRLREAASKY